MDTLQDIAGIEELTSEQLEAIKLLVDYDIDLTYKEVADKVGVHEKTLYNWRKNDDNFVEVKKKAAEAGLIEKIDKVNKALLKGALEGNARLLKLYYERVGMYVERQEISGPDGGAIETKQEYDLSNLSDEELDLMHEIQNKITAEGRSS